MQDGLEWEGRGAQCEASSCYHINCCFWVFTSVIIQVQVQMCWRGRVCLSSLFSHSLSVWSVDSDEPLIIRLPQSALIGRSFQSGVLQPETSRTCRTAGETLVHNKQTVFLYLQPPGNWVFLLDLYINKTSIIFHSEGCTKWLFLYTFKLFSSQLINQLFVL